MFDIISKIYNKVTTLGYFVYEKFCDHLSYLGIKITPAHFSSEDKVNYSRFISDNEGIVLEILRRTELPEHLKIINNQAKNYKFNVISTLTLFNNKPFKRETRNILSAIIKHIKSDNKDRNYFDRIIGANKYKLDPFKMILWLIQEYVSSTFVFFQDKPDELFNLNRFIDYLEKILVLQSIKNNKGFYNLLKDVISQLKTARNKLIEKIKINNLRNSISDIASLLSNHIDDINILLFNLFYMTVIKSKALITDIENTVLTTPHSNGFTVWFASLISFMKKSFTFDEKGLEDLAAHIFKLSKVNYAISAIDLSMQASRALNLDSELVLYEKGWFDRIDSVFRLQMNLLRWLVCHKAIIYVQIELEKSYSSQANANITDYHNAVRLINYLLINTKEDYASLIELKQAIYKLKLHKDIGKQHISLFSSLEVLLGNFDTTLGLLYDSVNMSLEYIDNAPIHDLVPNRYVLFAIECIKGNEFVTKITYEYLQNFLETPEGVELKSKPRASLSIIDANKSKPSLVSYLWSVLRGSDARYTAITATSAGVDSELRGKPA